MKCHFCKEPAEFEHTFSQHLLGGDVVKILGICHECMELIQAVALGTATKIAAGSKS